MIVVTGAGGVVGRALVAELEATGRRPRVAHRSPAKLAEARAAGQDAVALDTARPETLGPALEGAEAVFVLGAGGLGQEEGELAIVRAAKEAGARRVVKLSVWRAGDERYSLARMHRAIERGIERSGIAWTMLRPNGFMQNFVSHMAGEIRATGRFHLPAGDARISHVDVRDIARVAARALTDDEHAGRVYELSGPRAIGYAEAAEVLSRVLGREVRYVPVPDEAARAAMIGAGVPGHYADHIVDLHRAYREGVGSGVSSAVLDVTGRAPTSFEAFAETIAPALR